jgi:hypothetical protein
MTVVDKSSMDTAMLDFAQKERLSAVVVIRPSVKYIHT